MSGRRLPATYRSLAVAGAILMASGVALGAFGAHALESAVTASRLDTFETAARYQLIHGVALLAIAALERGARAGWLLGGGAAIFSGSLYVLVLADTAWLGAVAPVGGALMIAGWAWLAWSLARAPSARPEPH